MICRLDDFCRLISEQKASFMSESKTNVGIRWQAEIIGLRGQYFRLVHKTLLCVVSDGTGPSSLWLWSAPAMTGHSFYDISLPERLNLILLYFKWLNLYIV